MPGIRARRHFSQLSEFQSPGHWDENCRLVDAPRCWPATRKTTKREDRRIVRQALVDPTVTRSTIRADVGVAIVRQTISRHLAEKNLKSKRSFRALHLILKHRQLRLQWCQARSMWNVTNWQKVVFSDEPRFVLGTDDNRVRVWRHPGIGSNFDAKKDQPCRGAELVKSENPDVSRKSRDKSTESVFSLLGHYDSKIFPIYFLYLLNVSQTYKGSVIGLALALYTHV
ncbi:HTH_Tnp_Tc3_2 domain-containing protein [Trichonephila clavipes]|nr:HTH_Tnp_Tc3_2 domain-containing protein [Trichonephila clavipes]